MYSINSKINKIKKCKLDGNPITELDGFMMPSRKNGFKINNQVIKDVKVVNKKLASPLVSKKIINKYNRLIAILTELLISDDDTGETFREALNRIEKFRLEIKNKYRNYLKQKELEKMSKQLTALKKEANMRLMEIQDNYLSKDNGKSR